MSKKNKIIISVVGTLLFVAIIITGSVSWHMLEVNSRKITTVLYTKYSNLPYIMQNDAVYFDNKFFEENDLEFGVDDSHYFVLEGKDEVCIIGDMEFMQCYFIDCTRRIEGIESYSLCLNRKENSDKVPISIDIRCKNKNLTVLKNPTKYGGCSYQQYQNSWYIIQVKNSSKKYELNLYLNIKDRFEYSSKQIKEIEENIVQSLIDSILTYDDILSRSGL